MLRNKFVIGVVGVLFSIVVVYNLNFFLKKRGPARSQKETVSSAPPVDQDKPGESLMVSPFPLSRDKGSWKRDPFQYTGENRGVGKSAAREKTKVSGIKLQGVTVRDGKRFALVNGWVVKPGDRVDDVTIADISPYSIFVKDAGGIREISIYNDIRDKEK